MLFVKLQLKLCEMEKKHNLVFMELVYSKEEKGRAEIGPSNSFFFFFNGLCHYFKHALFFLPPCVCFFFVM